MKLKELFRHLLPAVVGIGGGWGSGLLVAGLERPLRFAAMALALLALGYVLARLNYFNQRLDVEERLRAVLELPKRLALTRERPAWPVPGYLAMAAAALVVAGSLAWSWHVVPCVVAGLALWWWGDDRFTRANSAFLREELEALQAKLTATRSAPAAKTAAAAPVATAAGVASASPGPAFASGVAAAPAGPAEAAGQGRAAMPGASSPATASPAVQAGSDAAARTAALMRAIEEKRKEDPLVGAKVGARELVQRLLQGMGNARGVHAESLLCTLGALAGYACQVSLRSEALSRGEAANGAFQVVTDTQGRRYFFGDALNARLVEGRHSVWNVATSGLRKAGLQALPDLAPVFSHVAASVGTPDFGIPRWPQGHQAGDLPIRYVKSLWPTVMPLLRQFTPAPAEWPLLFGFALQEALRLSREVLPPEVALQIVMESAVPMSRVDLQTAG